MKNFTFKYKNIIEGIISIIGLILTLITFSHNLVYINTFISIYSIKLELDNLKLQSIELIIFILPIEIRKKIHHLYEKNINIIEWGNLLLFVGITIMYNYYFGYPLLKNVGALTIIEFVVLLIEKKPVEKFHKIIDTFNSYFN